jgi:hypothetical protein
MLPSASRPYLLLSILSVVGHLMDFTNCELNIFLHPLITYEETETQKDNLTDVKQTIIKKV